MSSLLICTDVQYVLLFLSMTHDRDIVMNRDIVMDRDIVSDRDIVTDIVTDTVRIISRLVKMTFQGSFERRSQAAALSLHY